jgi:hypothetical protein
MINVVANCEENVSQVSNNGFGAAFGQQILYNSQLMTGNTCTLSEEFLRSQPFGLGEESPVNCQVVATNVMGDSESCAGSGAFMPILATIPDPCQNLRFVSRDSEQFTVGW